ncbi:unnamed protein product [Cuscuta campestris]|uniref:Bidirectional sugar transporter SWEET n=1 Tax=Cuscuta campestris TaxID=132261 RepID=A0A484KQE7_9ASTE|nr:unnamed protein product [Cuscuta campestris]
MLSRDTSRTVVGIIGNVIAIILFLSPMPTFVTIWKKKSVEQFSAVPYLATFVNCALWVLYGLPMVHPHSQLVVTTNGVGLAIETVYLLLFLAFSDSKKRLRLLLIIAAEVVFVAALSALVLTLAHNWKLRSAIVGSICMAGNIMMYASPLAVMKLVITTKSVEYMPFFLSLFSFLNAISWTSYAFIRIDPYILAPNGMGAVLGLAQLILYAMFYKSTKRIIAAREAAKGEVGLTQKGASADTTKAIP